MTSATVRDLCQVRHGGTPSKSIGAYWEGDIPWVSPKDMKLNLIIDASDHISEHAVANSATSLAPTGAILVVVRSGILAHSLPVARVGRPVAFNQDIKALIPDPQKVDPEYLYWFIRSKASDLIARGVKKGATVHSLISGCLEGLEVPLPSRDRQIRIVDLLSRADGIVRLRHEAQVKAKAIIPALFAALFGDPMKNPKGWPVRTLGSVLLAADYGSSKKASDDGVGLPLIRMGNVTYAGDVDLNVLKYVELNADEVRKFELESGDLLFNRTNSKELVGKTGLWESNLKAVAASYFIRLRVDETQVCPFYIWAYMNTIYMKRVLFDTARGAIGQANINSKELRGFSVPVPPLELQSRFEELSRSVTGIEAYQKSALSRADAAFQSVLARTFN